MAVAGMAPAARGARGNPDAQPEADTAPRGAEPASEPGSLAEPDGRRAKALPPVAQALPGGDAAQAAATRPVPPPAHGPDADPARPSATAAPELPPSAPRPAEISGERAEASRVPLPADSVLRGPGGAGTMLNLLQAEWPARLARQVAAQMLRAGAIHDIAVTPERLGALRIRIAVSGGETAVTITAEQAAAARLLAASEDQLAAEFEALGLRLGPFSAGSGDTGNGGAQHRAAGVAPAPDAIRARSGTPAAHPDQDPSTPRSPGRINLIA
ncbi:flagellar hook-length control protein FliK [Plastorhodobacter daqingensis]|uniref:Flagellar hook-length control protein FliK n=1 Tax=Plastorhodobacter daqingensis TaxID=1387281 RepID=A0ABW2ULG9_9RHOB